MIPFKASGCLLTLLLVYISLFVANGYKTGAPSDRCSTGDINEPNHGTAAQTSIAPFKMILSKNTYKENTEIHMTLQQNTGVSAFAGYLLEIRKKGTTERVGSFLASSDGKDVCSQGSRTHVDPTLKTKQDFTWKAPASLHGDLECLVTIVQEKQIFWTNANLCSILVDAAEKTATSAFYFYETPVSWQVAKQTCETNGQRLVNLESSEKTALVQDFVDNNWIDQGKNEYWTGLYDVDEGSSDPPNYKWSTGVSMTWTNWVSGEPNDLQQDFCIRATKGASEWRTMTCHLQYPALCENVDECLSSPCLNGGTCTDEVNGYTCVCLTGYTGNNCQDPIVTSSAQTTVAPTGTGIKYTFHPEKKTWEDAKSACQGEGQKLVNIETEAVSNALQAFIDATWGDTTGKDYWIGLSDQEQGINDPPNYVWSSSAPLSAQTWTNWKGGEPDKIDSDFCIKAQKTDNTWRTVDCSKEFPYVCWEEADICDSNPCQNGGTCTEQVIGYTCQCPPGFTGTNCEVPTTVPTTTTEAPTTVPTTTTAAPTTTVPTTTTAASGIVMTLYPEPESWEDAKTACSGAGQKLVNIETKEISDALQAFIDANWGETTGSAYWIGLSDQDYGENDPPNYVWSSSTLLADQAWTNWYSGEPNDIKTDYCIRALTNDASWRTIDCTRKYPYVCWDQADICASDPCQNGGTCTEQKNGYTCQCQDGFTGNLCQEVDECASGPCLNGGTCVDGTNSYTCTCPTGYSGNQCEITPTTAAPATTAAPTIKFSLYPEPKSWEDAKTACKGEGQKLVNIETKAISDALQAFVDANWGATTGSAYWIGLSDQDYGKNDPPNYVWSSSTLLADQTWTNWYSGEPNDIKTDYCIRALTNDASWRTIDCTRKYPYVCWDQADICASDPCQNGGTCTEQKNGYTCQCPDGFTGNLCQEVDECASGPCLNGGTCVDGTNSYTCTCPTGYSGNQCEITPTTAAPATTAAPTIKFTLYPEPKSWEDAKTACKGEGQKLVNIETKAISDALQAFVDANWEGTTGSAYWIGLSDQDYGKNDPPNYVWSSSTLLADQTWTNWYSGEPNDIKTDYCIRALTNDASWRTIDCTRKYPYVCWDQADICASNPCQNGGTCTEQKNGYTCQCPDGFTGNLCQEVDECASGPCLNGGTCVDGTNSYTCTCPTGYSGNQCEIIPTTAAPATTAAPTIKFTLYPEPKSWEDAKTACKGEGQKLVNIETKAISDALQAFVDANWGGTTGSAYWIGLSDQDYGKNDPPNYVWSSSTLLADQTWTNWYSGEPNDIKTDYCIRALTNDASWRTIDCTRKYPYVCWDQADICASDPCQNGGTCTEQKNGYTCQCPDGFTGNLCQEVDECVSGPCLNGGTCVDGTNSYTCTCPTGYSGNQCEITPIKFTLYPEPKSWEDAKTACKGEGQKLVNIETKAISDALQAFVDANWGGTTGSAYWIGLSDQDYGKNDPPNYVWSSSTLLADQTWTNWYSGEPNDIKDDYCIRALTNDASWRTIDCTRKYPYVCWDQADICASDPCQNGGTCTEQKNGYICQCPNGFFGNLCQEVDECASGPCLNGGTCVDGTNSYTCTCPTGYSGNQCEITTTIKFTLYPEPKSWEDAKTACKGEGQKLVNIETKAISDALQAFVDANWGGTTGSAYWIGLSDQDYGKNDPPNYVWSSSTLLADQTWTNWYSGEPNDIKDDYCIRALTNDASWRTIDCTRKYPYVCWDQADICASDPCQNGGTCTEQKNGYTCQCPDGFTGNLCQEVDECASGPCLNGGTCVDGTNSYTCTCPTGYSGNQCEITPTIKFTLYPEPKSWEDAKTACKGEGQKLVNIETKAISDALQAFVDANWGGTTGSAYWIGLSDQDYGKNDPPNYVWSSSTLLADQAWTNWYSGEPNDIKDDYCIRALTNDASWRTIDCTRKYPYVCWDQADICASDPCQNGGTCTEQKNGYLCQCPIGFFGNLCQEVDECASGPCLNGGTCVDGTNSYTCTCPTGYSGNQCEINIDDCAAGPCLNGGTCVDGVNSYQCTCPAGYTGTHCEEDINECLSSPCQNGGTCTDGVNGYVCVCTVGFSAVHCEDTDDCTSNPCLNGGTCVDGWNGYTCTCPPGFSGDRCDEGCTAITCESKKHKFNKCSVTPGLELTLKTQHSSTKCIQDDTYGFTDTYIWVDDGCRADFSVCEVPGPLDKVDVTFLVDSSSTITPENVAKIEDFVKSIITQLDIGEDKVHVGLMQYSDGTSVVYPLNEYYDKTDALNAVDGLTSTGDGTNTTDALNYMRENMLSPEFGARSQVRQIAVVITDGFDDDPAALNEASDKLLDDGIQLIPIGVGSGIDPTQLDVINDAPNSTFYVDTFDDLKDLTNDTLDKASEIPTTTPLPTTVDPTTQVDVTFIIDSSASVGPENFEKLSDFVKNVIKQLDIGEDKVHAALIQFSDDTSVVLPLDNNYDRPELYEAVDGITIKADMTNTSDAIDFYREQLKSPDFGARPVRQIAILVTDGSEDDEADILKAAEEAKKDGVEFVTIGIGPDSENDTLDSIAKDPDSSFHVDTFDDLDNLTSLTADTATQAPKTTQQPTTTVPTTVAQTTTPVPTTPPMSTTPAETGKTDITFILDSSYSIGPENFDKMTDFVNDVITQLDVGPDDIHVAVTQYADTLSVVAPLDKYYTVPELTQTVDGVQLMGTDSNTADAVDGIQELISSPEFGARPNARQLVVVITDGGEDDKKALADAADKAREDGIDFVAIGIGPDVDQQDLDSISNNPNTSHKVETFDELKDVTNKTVETASEVVPVPTTTATTTTVQTTTPASTGKTDITFILDSSYSIGPDNFDKMTDFVKDVITQLDVGPDDIHVAVTQYADTTSIVAPLDKYYTVPELTQAVDGIQLMGTESQTADAVDGIRELISSPEFGARPNARQLVVVVTDGGEDDKKALEDAADKAREDGIDFVAIGIGPDVDKEDLDSISNNPNTSHKVETFDELKDVTNKTVETAREVVPVPTTTATTTTVQTTTPACSILFCGSVNQGRTQCDVPAGFTASLKEELPSSICTLDDSYGFGDTYIWVDKGCRADFNLCSIPPTTVAPTTTTQSNIMKADVTFIVDSSNNIGPDNFKKMTDFVNSAIEQLNVGPDDVHVALMQYADDATVVIPLDKYYTKPELTQTVDGFTLQGDGTQTSDALDKIREQISSPTFGSRPDARQIAVVVTDGGDTDKVALTEAAEKAREDGIELVAIGIGADVDDELNSISTDSKVQVNTYDELKDVTDQAVDITQQKMSICTLPPVAGTCQTFILNWNYNSGTKRCDPFLYGGCGGNENRFSSENECLNRCNPASTALPSTPAPEKVFYLYSEPMTWEDAKATCENNSQTLVNVESESVSQDLQIFANDNWGTTSGVEFWIGLHDPDNGVYSPPNYKWSSSIPLADQSWTNWYNNEPNDLESDFCVRALKTEVQWRTISCVNKYPFICEGKTATNVCTLAAEPGNCREFVPAWHYNPAMDRCDMFIYGGCGGNENRFNTETECLKRCNPDKIVPDKVFTLYSEPMSWSDAQEVCHSNSQTLVNIESEGTSDVLDAFLNAQWGTTGGDVYWTGLHDPYAGIYDPPRYRWSSLTPLSEQQWTNWYINEPNDFESSYCVRAVRSDTQWRTISCLEKHPFVCEGTPVTPTGLPTTTTHPPVDKVDLTLLVDSSDSIAPENFEKLADFLKNIIQGLDIGKDNVRVALTQYSGQPIDVLTLNTDSTTDDILKALNNMAPTGEGTNTANAVNHLTDQTTSPDSGARSDVPQIAIIVTDGGTEDEDAVKEAADKARQNGIEIITVGVGPNVNPKVLDGLSDPNSGSVDTFKVNSYDDLKGLTGPILQSASQKQYGSQTTTTPIQTTAKRALGSGSIDALDDTDKVIISLATIGALLLLTCPLLFLLARRLRKKKKKPVEEADPVYWMPAPPQHNILWAPPTRVFYGFWNYGPSPDYYV